MRGLALVSGLLAIAAPVSAELRAERIREETAAVLDVGGPDAIGGVGDWWLANGLVEAVIDDVSREHAKSNHGGTLVDLGLAGVEGEDQFARLIPMLNLSQRLVAGYDAVRAELDAEAGAARVIVTSSGVQSIPRGGWLARALDPLVAAPEDVAGVEVETVYELRRGESFLRLVTTLRNTGDAVAPVFAFGDLWMRGGRSGRGFAGHATRPARSRGFAALSTGTSAASARSALGSFTHLALVGSSDFPAIAYGYAAPERLARGLELFGMMQEHASLALAFVGDPDAGGLSAWRVLRAWQRGLPAGESWRFERRVAVAGRRAVAALEPALALAPDAPVGRVRVGPLPADRAGAVVIETLSGAAVSQLDAQGGEVALPPGDYAAVRRIAHGPAARRAFRIEAGSLARVDFEAPPATARLLFARGFADGGAGRIELRGRGGSADPVFGDDGLGATLDGEPMPSGTASSALLFAGARSDPREAALPPGRYRLTASRGLDWEIATREIEVGEGARLEVEPFALEPLPPLEGWLRADLHVHAQASDDSQTPQAERLRRFAAEGMQVLIATDHDHVADYAPDLARLGLEGRLRVVTGVEVTSSTPSVVAPYSIGHHNAWPIPLAPHAHRDGAPPSQNRSVGQLYTELRRDYGARVLQLNHPRAGRAPGDAGGDSHFLDHLGVGRPLDPSRPEDAPEGALGFDALEIMNGPQWHKYLASRADWIGLLRAGRRATATANSDSHAPDELVGYPRNYVFTGAAAGDPAAFDAALRAGKSFGTTGPRLRRFRVNGAAPGESADAPGGRVRVEFAVDAASWVPLDEVRVLLDGHVVHAGIEREGALELVLEADGFLHLEAGAPLGVEPEAWIAAHPGPYTEVVAPGFVSAAFGNPVFVQVSEH